MPRFIYPALPQTRPAIPRGDIWLHEPKLDGWRVQAIKDGQIVRLLSKNGFDCTRQFKPIATAVAGLTAVTAILDGEVVALGADGQPDFLALHLRRSDELRFYAFDILSLDGDDLRELPLHQRKQILGAQVDCQRHPLVRDVASFDDGHELLAECERRRLEGVVSKRRDAPYRSGPRCGWVKVKTKAWREDNRDRHRLFE